MHKKNLCVLKKGARAVARDGFTPFSSTSLSFSSLLYIVRCENSSFCLVKKSSAGERCRVSEWALGFHSVLLHDNRMFSAKAESDEGWDDVMLRGAPDDEAALSRSSRPNHTPRGWRRRRNNNIMRVRIYGWKSRTMTLLWSEKDFPIFTIPTR